MTIITALVGDGNKKIINPKSTDVEYSGISMVSLAYMCYSVLRNEKCHNHDNPYTARRRHCYFEC